MLKVCSQWVSMIGHTSCADCYLPYTKWLEHEGVLPLVSIEGIPVNTTEDDSARDLALEEGMTVQLTPRSAESEGLAVVAQSIESFEVRELRNGTGTYDFHWEVKAIRKGHEDYQVIRPTLDP